MSGPITMELFCCGGGMAEGFRRAGIHIDMAVDKDPNACDSYEENMGHRPIQIDVHDLVRMTKYGWRPAGVVDLLISDPPCTPWSRAGKRRGLEDERDCLLPTIRMIELLRPANYLIGNVPGLDDSNNSAIVDVLLGRLGRIGYCTLDYTSLDAADFGVPQHRRRPFWFGHLAGPCIKWPMRTHGPADSVPLLPGVPSVETWRTCADALGHLPAEKLGRRAVLIQNRGANVDEYGNVLVVKENKGHLASRLHEPSKMVMTNSEHSQSGGGLLEWPWDRPATTVCARNELGAAGRNGRADGDSQSRGAILLSEIAATILQGFPETWRWCGKTKRSRWSQIGQAMPPALAEAVALAIKCRNVKETT